jgi:hypothetical protein
VVYINHNHLNILVSTDHFFIGLLNPKNLCTTCPGLFVQGCVFALMFFPGNRQPPTINCRKLHLTFPHLISIIAGR